MAKKTMQVARRKIIVEQWTADEQGNEHPPCVGTVREWDDEAKSV